MEVLPLFLMAITRMRRDGMPLSMHGGRRTQGKGADSKQQHQSQEMMILSYQGCAVAWYPHMHNPLYIHPQCMRAALRTNTHIL